MNTWNNHLVKMSLSCSWEEIARRTHERTYISSMIFNNLTKELEKTMDDASTLESFFDFLDEIKLSTKSDYQNQIETVSLLIKSKKILEKHYDKGSTNKKLIVRTIVIIDVLLDNRIYQMNMNTLRTKQYT